MKTIKTSAKIIATITVKNELMQNALNWHLTNTKKMNIKVRKTSSIFLKNILEKVSLDVGFLKVEGSYP